jgi:hypothetical protein
MMITARDLLDKNAKVVAFWLFDNFGIVLLAGSRLPILIGSDEKYFVNLHLNYS